MNMKIRATDIGCPHLLIFTFLLLLLHHHHHYWHSSFTKCPDRLASEPSSPLVSTSLARGLEMHTAVPNSLFLWCRYSKLRPSCSHGKHVTSWAISLALCWTWPWYFWMTLSLGLSSISPWLNSSYVPLAGLAEVMTSSSVHYIRRFIILVCFVIGDGDYGQLDDGTLHTGLREPKLHLCWGLAFMVPEVPCKFPKEGGNQ